MQRASLVEEERPDATLYVDETHNYLALRRSEWIDSVLCGRVLQPAYGAC